MTARTGVTSHPNVAMEGSGVRCHLSGTIKEPMGFDGDIGDTRLGEEATCPPAGTFLSPPGGGRWPSGAVGTCVPHGKQGGVEQSPALGASPSRNLQEDIQEPAQVTNESHPTGSELPVACKSSGDK